MTSPFANTLVRVLLAPECAGCGATLSCPLVEPVCRGCLDTVQLVPRPWCSTCGVPIPAGHATPACARCTAAPRSFVMARSAGLYEGVLRELIHQFKYGKRRQLARLLARLAIATGDEVLADVAALVPVPLHPWRQLSRGFNQADDLAVALGLPVWRLLRRSRRGPMQIRLAAHERDRNVNGAFSCRSARARRLMDRRLNGRPLLLVDDVMTTGATAEACSRTLIAAGASEVRVLTVARAVAARPR